MHLDFSKVVSQDHQIFTYKQIWPVRWKWISTSQEDSGWILGNLKKCSGLSHLTYSIPTILAPLHFSLYAMYIPNSGPLNCLSPLTKTLFFPTPYLHAGFLSSLRESVLKQTVSCPPKFMILFHSIELLLESGIFSVASRWGHVLRWLTHPCMPGTFLAWALKVPHLRKPLSMANWYSWSHHT